MSNSSNVLAERFDLAPFGRRVLCSVWEPNHRDDVRVPVKEFARECRVVRNDDGRTEAVFEDLFTERPDRRFGRGRVDVRVVDYRRDLLGVVSESLF